MSAGSFGCWAMKAGDFQAREFPGTPAGVNEAIAYCASNGVVQLYPGSAGITPTPPAGVLVIKQDSGVQTIFGGTGTPGSFVNALNYPTIQAAHDALPSTGGGVLYIPAGIYTPSTVPAFNGLVVSKNNITITGDPYASTVLRFSSAQKDTHMIDLAFDSPNIDDGIMLRDFMLWGPEVPATSEEQGIGVRLHRDGFQNLHMNNVTIYGTGSWGMSIKTIAGTGAFIGECQFDNVACYGAKSGGSLRLGGAGLNAFLFTKCQFNGPPFGTYGAGGLSRGSVHMDWCYSMKFDRCSFQDRSCGTALSITSATNNIGFDDCLFETNTVAGDLGQHWITAATATNPAHIKFKNCIFLRSSAPNHGIKLLKTHSDTNLLGWVFEDCKMEFSKSSDNANDDLVLGAGGRGVTMIRCERKHASLPESSWIIAGAGDGLVEFIEKPRGVLTADYAASYTPNAKSAETVLMTLTGGVTINTPTLPQRGLRLTFVFRQDGTGGRNVAWNSIFKGPAWSNTGNAANTRSSITFCYDDTNWITVSPQIAWA